MYYVTKYALTEGISAVPETMVEVHGEYIYVALGSTTLGIQVPRKDWFTDLESALARVDELVQRRIWAIEKQMKKMASYKAKIVDWSKDSRSPKPENE